MITRLFVLMLAALCSGQGIITTIAGNGSGSFSGNGGPATGAGLGPPQGVAVDPSGNVYFTDNSNGVVRVVNPAGTISTFAGCNPVTGACIQAILGNEGPATGVVLSPLDVVTDQAGNVYLADGAHNIVYKVNAAGVITIVAGNGKTGSTGDGGPATSAELNGPEGIALDSAGNVYIADSLNSRIRKVSTSGVITTVAGSTYGFGGDGGPATSAMLAQPKSIAVDSAGNLYIADSLNFRVRKVNTAGVISTFAGTGNVGLGAQGDGGPATSASLSSPWGITLDGAGNVFFSDWTNNLIRKVNTAGVISTIAGQGTGGLGDGGPATSATLSWPEGLRFDSAGNLYIADNLNNRVRKITGVGSASSGGGGGLPAVTLIANAEGEVPTIAPNTWVEIKGSNLAPAGDTRIWAGADFVNNQLPTSLDGVSVRVNGQSAYVYYISPTQINILTPPNAIQGTVSVQVTNNRQATLSTVQAAVVAPSVFVFNGGPYVAAEHANYSFIGPPTLYAGLTTPAKPGETISIYANGFGTTSAAIVAGSETQTGNLPSFPVVSIGGQTAVVTFAGLVGPGEYLINVMVPSGLADGDHALTMSYQGEQTQSGVLITTKQ